MLSWRGFFPEHWLPTFTRQGSRLGSHPDRLLVPGVEASTGSLGHGLPLAVGVALALRAKGADQRVVVLTGDAELNEGSNWEAIMLAPQLRLGNLTLLVIDNRSSTIDLAPIHERLAVFGWHAEQVDGRDHAALEAALSARHDGPAAVVADRGDDAMIAMRAQAIDTVAELFEDDPRVAVVLAEISVERFEPVFAHDPARAVNVGIMEQTMVGVAAGYALEGFHPVIHTITPFVAERALEQLKLDFGHQQLGVLVITVGGSYDYGSEGPTHHSPGDVQALLTIPATEILVPGAAAEADRLVRATYANGRLTYLRTQLVVNRAPRDVEFGRLLVERRGPRATVIAVGPMLDRTLDATAGMDVTVLYATTLSPFDAETLNRELAGDDVFVVEPFYAGTLASILTEALARPSRPAARHRRATGHDPRLRHRGAARPRAGPGRRGHPPADRVCDRLIRGIPTGRSPFQYRPARCRIC